MKVSFMRNANGGSCLHCRFSLIFKTVTFLIGLVFFSLWLRAQEGAHVRGRIVNENGQPVARASVLVKGKTTGVTSDDGGNFDIVAPANSTLVISSVGFSPTEIKVGGRTHIDVRLNTVNNSLDQVVVVGYGTQKKKDVTGSVVSVSGATLQEVPTANLISELKGRAAGVDIISNSATPGAGGQIRIRGNRSLSAELPNNNIIGTVANNDALNAPLLVLDGVPFSGSINDLNPDNIANIDILKDASATAIYGSRGSNGVLMITTKRGKPGKAIVSYYGYYGFSNITDEYKVFNGKEYAAYKEEARLGNTINPGTTAYGLSPDEQAGVSKGTSTDWQKLIYQQGHVTDHEINVSGGTETTLFSLNGGFFKETGVMPGQDFTRYSLGSSIDHHIGSKIKIGISTLNTLSYTNGASLNPTQTLIRLSPLTSPYRDDGSFNLYPMNGLLDAFTVNPLTIKTDGAAIQNTVRRIRTFNSLYGEWEIIKGLKYRINVGLDFRQEQSNNYLGPNTTYNTSISLAQANESVLNSETWTYTIDNILTYDKTFSDKHRITFTGLYGVQKDHTQGGGIYGTGLPADYIQSYNLSLASSVAGSIVTQNNPWNFSERGLISYMGRINYEYDNRFLVTATIRTDGSSVLSPGNQYFTYPAFAVGWNLNNERFMNRISAVSNLKIRAGWGIASSQGINPYATLGSLSTNAYNFGPGTAGQNIGYLVTTLANKNLKWQSTSQYNIGIDFGLFKNRINGSVDVYSQKTDNILLQESLPASNGAGSTIVNAGKTKGHGVEINLSTINIQSRSGFTWSTDINFTINREEIVALQNPSLKSDIVNGWFVGQPLTVIYDVKKLGIWQTADSAMAASYGQHPGQIRVEDINGPANDGKPDGKITADDRQILGNYQPKWIGGITNRFAYKGFDFTFVIYARMGMKVAVPYITTDGGAQGFDFFNNGRNNQVKINYWTPTNPTNDFPRPDASADKFLYSSTLGYVDGSFIKMRSITLGYTIPSKHLERSGIRSIRVFAAVQNPFILYSPFVSKGYGPDPEGNGYAGGVTSSVSNAAPTVPLRAVTVTLNVPPTRQFQFGLNLKF